MEMIVLVREDRVEEAFLALLGSSEAEYEAEVKTIPLAGQAIPANVQWRLVTPPLPDEERLQKLADVAVEKLEEGGGEWLLDLPGTLMTLPELYALASRLHLSVGLVAVLRRQGEEPVHSR